MAYNSTGTSFQPLGVNPVFQPAVSEPTRTYSNLTTAQCAANSALTSVAVTSGATSVVVEAGKKRTTGMIVIVPTDQPAVAFGNIAAISPGPLLPVTPINQTFTPSSPGFTVLPGNALSLNPFNDPMYAVTPLGVAATIYFIDP